MSLHRIFCMVATLAMAQLALAKLPFSNDVFGRIEGTLDFCARANPQTAQKYEERKKQMVRDVPEEEVAKARGTKDYKEAYEWVSDTLGNAPKDQAVEACKASLEEK